MVIRQSLARAWLLGALACLPACAHGESTVRKYSCPVPDDVQLEIEASDRVNPDENGRSLPTRLRIYQVTDLTRLQAASFEDLWAHAKATLADTLLNSEELIVYPGQVLVHRLKRNGQADYLVGVAVFRETEGEGWRTAQELPLRGDPCQQANVALPPLDKLRLRMFLEDDRIESVNNYSLYPKRRCAAGADCASGNEPRESGELRRNQRLRTFEEDPREPAPERVPSQ